MCTLNHHIHAKLPPKSVWWTEKQKAWDGILALPPVNCVILSQPLKCSAPQLLYLRNGHSANAGLTLQFLYEFIYLFIHYL